ncbi:MAG: YajQ family cyclic di-GMP-binding protein [Proteobacteria bacterium]|nr:YajQ family cyclic di-GMP-binding protein [Pseudomonadota bacterium]
MPSFDIVSRIDMQEVDNAVNNAKKEISTRYDLRQSRTELELDRKEGTLKILAADKMKLKAVQEILLTHLVRRKIEVKSVVFSDPEGTSQGFLKCQGSFIQGIDKDTAKKIAKMIKDSKMKVQSAIQEDQLRVTGKKIDDLQSVISLLKESDLEIPLQYVNMKD